MSIINPLSTLNAQVAVTSGTGAINVGTDSVAKTITVGNATGATAVVVNSGTGNISLSSTGSASVNASGGAINIGNNANAQAINIGTGAAARTITIGNTTGATGLVLNTGSSGVSIPSFTNTGALVSNASGLITNASGATAGLVLTSNGSGSVPTFQSPTTNNILWTTVTGTTQAMSPDVGYVANNASQVVFTLPATSAVGKMIYVMGYGAGGWQIAQNAGQQIVAGSSSTTVGTGGSLTSLNQYDSVTLVCIVADTVWACLSVYSAGLTGV